MINGITKELRNIAPDPTNQEKMKQIREAFEKQFGKDDHSRTRLQWGNLVAQYGIDTVSRMSGLSRGAVKRKMKK